MSPRQRPLTRTHKLAGFKVVDEESRKPVRSKEPKGPDRPSIIRQAVTWLVLVVLIAAGTILWIDGWLPGQFTVRKLVIRGCQLTDADTVVSSLDYVKGDGLSALWLKSRHFDPAQDRWIKKIRLKPRNLRFAVIDVEERLPLLYVTVGGTQYWLCSDGKLVETSDSDIHPVFARIRELPRVQIATVPEQMGMIPAHEILTTIACCEETLPYGIDALEISADGKFTLFDKSGFKIKLGEPVDLRQKIGALPLALRNCEKDREKLRYLDASNPKTFYKKWQDKPES